MANKFFSLKMRWKRVLLASLIATLVVFTAVSLFWYIFYYLPVARNASESQKISEYIKQHYGPDGLPLRQTGPPSQSYGETSPPQNIPPTIK